MSAGARYNVCTGERLLPCSSDRAVKADGPCDVVRAEQERLPRPESEPRQQSLPAGGLDDVTAQVAGLRMSHHAPDPFAGACRSWQGRLCRTHLVSCPVLGLSVRTANFARLPVHIKFLRSATVLSSLPVGGIADAVHLAV